VLESETYLYSFNTLSKLDMVETSQNLLGICAICNYKSICTIALPGKTVGSVVLRTYCEGTANERSINAHKKCITILALSEDGRLLATASAKVLRWLGNHYKNIQLLTTKIHSRAQKRDQHSQNKADSVPPYIPIYSVHFREKLYSYLWAQRSQQISGR
jgi:WD40 repeat protein